MKKERVLVRDDRGVFIKMFKRKLKDKFEFLEMSFFSEEQKDLEALNHIIYVVYDKLELLGFLKQERKDQNVVVCLFNKQFYQSLSFLEEEDSLLLFDESKTRIELFKELKTLLDKNSKSDEKKGPLLKPDHSLKKFHDYYKAMYFLM